MRKFQVISVAKFKTSGLVVDKKDIDYCDGGKIPGLTISRRGILPHINERAQRARHQFAQISRFHTPETKLYIY